AHTFGEHPDQLSAAAPGCGTQEFCSAVVVLRSPISSVTTSEQLTISLPPSGNMAETVSALEEILTAPKKQ
ncbi:MAG: hypothetical protein IKZ33_09160, partial [Lentisphaeria bacterium]|nr:hypothetical protein [Lentisphaeria bacterium]